MSLREELDARHAPLLAPLSPAPGGRDMSFDPSFEAAKAEIDKLTSVSGGKPNWTGIIEGTSRLLTNDTKDFRLVIWWALATVQQRPTPAFADLAAAAHLVLGMVHAHWTTAFPDVKRSRGRANLYAWLTEQIDPLFDGREVVAEEREAVVLSQSLLEELDAALAERLGESHPGPGRLRGSMNRFVRALPADAPPQPPPPAPAPVGEPRRGATAETHAYADDPQEGGGGDRASTPAPSVMVVRVEQDPFAPPALLAAAPTSADEARGALDTVTPLLFDVADLLRADAPDDPTAYRVSRLAARLLPAALGNVDDVRPPEGAAVTELGEALSREDWAAVVEVGERLLRASPSWLELHYTLSTALAQLGRDDARKEADRGAREILARFDGQPEPRFFIIPYATEASRKWLHPPAPRARAVPAEGGNEEAAPPPSVAQHVETLGDAVKVANRAGSGRERFRGMLQAGTMAIEQGQFQLARAVLESLLDVVGRHQLEEWDPALCASLYQLLIQALRGQGGENPDQGAREAQLFDKLCRIDPEAALALTQR
ncbi:MAG: type VI secretion system domain-containing protein [Myxococcales bacterium]|nr:type VI secretion system domain-containing protein [Myxococcales bacterium]